MNIKMLVILVIILGSTACAVYDSKRGVFVSSSVQTVKLDSDIAGRVNIDKFQYPLTSKSSTQENTYAINGSFVPVSHTYVFDDIDRKNLEQSVISSFKQDGKKDASVSVTFRQIGMAHGYMGDTPCVMVAEITVTRGSSSVSEIVNIKESGFTVAGSKDNAIKQLIVEISSIVSKHI
jgi:hypothetical protein